MKIGILTFHHVNNYGAMLQAYALQKFIADAGHIPIIINKVAFTRVRHPFLSGWGLSSGAFFSRFTPKLKELKKYKKFNVFRSDVLNISPPVNNLLDYATTNNIDAFVVGSDQVWNAKYGTDSLALYFLDELTDYSGIRVAYAACCGNPDQPTTPFEGYFDLSKRFHHISVRNKFTQDFLSRFSEVTTEVVVDPTILIDWADEFYDKTNNFETGDYIFVYGFNQLSDEACGLAKEQLCIPVIGIGMEGEYRMKNVDKVVHNAGPSDWLNIMRNSSFVITKSFHGMMLSIKLKKQFVAIASRSPGCYRLEDAGSQLGVLDRVVSNMQQILDRSIIKTKMDYHKIDSKVESAASDSVKFLYRSVFEKLK